MVYGKGLWHRRPFDGAIVMPDAGKESTRALEQLHYAIFQAWREGRKLSAAKLDEMLDDASPQNAPGLVYSAVCSDVVTGDVLAGAMCDLWRYSYPAGPDRDGWIEMFRKAGYTSNGKPASAPRNPCAVYRAAWDDERDGRHGLSWTPDYELARDFYGRWSKRQGQTRPVWTVEAPPDRLLCWIGCSREYLIDAAGLDIRECQ